MGFGVWGFWLALNARTMSDERGGGVDEQIMTGFWLLRAACVRRMTCDTCVTACASMPIVAHHHTYSEGWLRGGACEGGGEEHKAP